MSSPSPSRAGPKRRARALLAPAALALAAGPAALPALAADHPVPGALLRLRDPARPAGRRVEFRSERHPIDLGPAVRPDDAETVTTLEIAGTNAGDGSSGVVALPASRWRALGRPAGSKGFRYRDPAASDGVRLVLLWRGRRGARVRVAGGGARWGYAIAQAQGPIEIRLRVGHEVLCAEFSSFARNAPGGVLARRAPPPPGCAGASATCGDGIVDGGDECDDGNRRDGDGCSAACQLEDARGLCAGVPAVAGTALATELVASGLARPVHLAAPPLDPRRLFVVEQAGRVRVVRDGTLLPSPFLDIGSRVSCCRERGLLGIAFHPRYETTGRFFVHYTDAAGSLVIARWEVGPSPDQADATSERILLTIPHPRANHNGGQLAFGPDGHLYVGPGDGGGGGDPDENAQDGGSLLGKLLRLDVDVDTPPYHRVPPTNPFVGAGDPRDEIWALGLRNPWRFSFDRGTGDLYIADVGQDAREEVNVAPAASPGGENYAWDVFEGSVCFEPAPAPVCPAPPTGFTMPVLEYDHDEGCSITGGFVYRGCAMPDLHGTYFYSDFCTPFVRTFRGVIDGVAVERADRTAELAPGGGRSLGEIVSFGEDARGEHYVVDLDGEVFRIVPGG